MQDLAKGRRDVSQLESQLDGTRGPKKRGPLIDALKRAVGRLNRHIKEVRQKWTDEKSGAFEPPDGYVGEAPDLRPPRINIPNR